MNINKQQSGVGLIEVLVSILLLSVAVLGFSTLQMTSVKATGESLKRTQAMSIARGLAENLRVNPNSIANVQTVVNDPSQAGTINLSSCQTLSDTCSSEDLAVKDALTVLNSAADYEVSIGMETCAGTVIPTVDNSEVACIVVSWNTTNPFTDSSTRASLGPSHVNCADSNGTYYPNADCIIVEAY